MPFPNAHTRITWFGDAYSQQEEWSTGVRLNGVAAPSPAQLDSLDAAFAALFSSGALETSGAVRYLGVKSAPQDVAGLYPANASALIKLRAQPLVGGSQGMGLPQATIVATLTTATPRGLANEGRMYLPATAHTPTIEGRISSAQATAVASAVVTFVNAVDAVGIGTVSVFSKVLAGAVRDVTGVRIGRVIDTQRRRRNRIPELYVRASTGN